MGATVDEALAAAEVALADFAKLMEENGESIPQPSAIEDVELEAGEMVTYVPLSAPAHAPAPLGTPRLPQPV